MVKAHPYDSLGSILAAGGDAFLARAAAGGATKAALIVLAAEAFPAAAAADRAAVVEIGEAAAAAGRAAQAALEAGEEFSGRGGINPRLFGDDPQGNRHRVAFSMVDNETGLETPIHRDTPTLDNLRDDLEKAMARAKQIEQYIKEQEEKEGFDYDRYRGIVIGNYDVKVNYILSRF